MVKHGEVLSHWGLLIENFRTSSLDFYAKVESAVSARELPEVQTERVELSEGGVGSAKRTYLHFKRGKLSFHICGAQYGTGHFFSWWMSERHLGFPPVIGWLVTLGVVVLYLWMMISNGLVMGTLYFLGVLAVGVVVAKANASGGDERLDDFILSVPLIGYLYFRFFMQDTYYRLDTRAMFQQTIQRAVTSVVEELNSAQGLRALRPDELQPTVRSILK